MQTLKQLLSRFPREGTLGFIAVRPARRAPVIELAEAELTHDGLAGDHRRRPGDRAVTLLQAEHLAVIAALCGRDRVEPHGLRRNLLVSGINLAALRGHRLRIGDALVLITGPCAPCSRMEEVLGEGGYNAMRNHGGMTASVIEPGRIRIGDRVIEAGSEEAGPRPDNT